uniref:Methyltransferase domain-containing protein n=1 Tax=Hucho hucho TaxID=62062 RepID=A0A4W5Q3Z0_9TELE
MQPFDLAVDVGCGLVQGTVLLAPHFSSVVGTDVIPAQLRLALEHATAPNISYRTTKERPKRDQETVHRRHPQTALERYMSTCTDYEPDHTITFHFVAFDKH